MSIEFDTHELATLATDLPKLGREGAKKVHAIVVEGGDELRDEWRKNATKTSGKHGKLYPKSIDSNLKLSTDIVVEIGPNPSKPQGGMSFEDGSVNQPAHHDGKKAADEILPKIEGRITTALFHMFGLGQ